MYSEGFILSSGASEVRIMYSLSSRCIMKGIQAQPDWTLPAASAAFLGIGLIFGLWWWYFDRAAAARYSFLLSVPAVVLSGLFELGEIGGEDGASAGATVIATLVSFASGYAAIAWLLRYLANHTLDIFVAYRIPLGILVIALTATGTIS